MNDKLRDRILWVLFILIGICTLISVSYAYFVVSGANNANLNISVSAPSCASIDITSGTSVNITGEYAAPISDAKALSSDVFRSSFTLKNGCDKEQSLSVLLVPSSSSTMNPKALKYVLIEQDASLPKEGTLVTKEMELSANTQKELLSKYGQTYNVKAGYELTNVSISSNEEKSYYLYLWIDYDEGGLGNGITLNTNLTSALVLGTGTDVGELSNSLYSNIAKRYNAGDTYVKLYNGSDYGDTTTYKKNIYYFNGAVENNNVLFADKCWKMVRTTDTGGVKIVYNGVPKYTVSTEPINQDEYINVANDATYPYTFDSTNKTWTSTNHTDGKTGTITFSVNEDGDYYLSYSVSSESGYDKAYFYKNDNIVGSDYYSGTVSGSISLTGLTTSDVIIVKYTKDNSSSGGSDNVVFSIGKAVGDVIKSCNNTGTDSQIGTSWFNSSQVSPAYVGYMYNENKVYTYSSKAMVNNTYFSGTKAYADAVTYDSSTNKYTLTSATTLSVTSSNINTLVGKYTCNSSSTTETCTNVYYIVGYNGYYIYYYSLSSGDVDGTDNGSDYVFGSSFTYTNGTYTLTNTTTINTDTWSANKTNVNTHHYTCLTNGNSCTSVYYIYYDYNGTLFYITLTEGKSANDAINEMLYADDVNTKDSGIKAYIDTWYANNMTGYTVKLEDTVFCNDRSMSNGSSNGWNPNGGSTTTILEFKNYYNTSNKSLVCANETDRFSVNNPKAQLKYPIGLLTVPELILASYGSGHYFNSGQYVWLGSPGVFSDGFANGREVYSGGWDISDVTDWLGVRPSISLKPGTIISSGDGSYTNPFVIE